MPNCGGHGFLFLLLFFFLAYLALEMFAAPVIINQTPQRNIPQHLHLQQHRCENLKYRSLFTRTSYRHSM